MTTKEQLWSAGRELVLSAPQLYVDVDVEADGIAGYGSMLSIGAQSPTGESFYSEIKPHSELYIPKNRAMVEQYGLVRERLFDEAPDITEVMSNYNDWLSDLTQKTGKKTVFTAFNAGFDWAHVDLGFTLAKLENTHGVAPFDLKSLALPIAGWDWAMTQKRHLPKDILPDGDFTHHALEDAQYQQKIHFGLAALLGNTYHSIVNHQ